MWILSPFLLILVMTPRSATNKVELTKRWKFADHTDRFVFKPVAFEVTATHGKEADILCH